MCVCVSYLSSKVEEEASVVYASIVIQAPAKTRNDLKSYSDVIYGEIKV